MVSLIQNEITKIFLKKKMTLIAILLIVLVGLFAYGEKYAYDKTISKFESSVSGASYDWKSLVNQQIEQLKGRVDSPYIPESAIQSINIQIEQLEYFVSHDLNPITPSTARFTVEFMEQSIILFLPLLIIILAADLISSEFSNRTIKLLLTRAVPRWKVLLSKYLALVMMTTMVILLIGIISGGVSRLFFGVWGFDEPIATGFKYIGGTLNSDSVIRITRLEYMFLVYALGWFVSIAIASITFMISALVRSTATAIGIIMASLIGGQFLQFFLSDWGIVKYFFVSNLNLIKYLTGSFQPIEGMSLVFSVLVLSVWSVVSLVISFFVFSKQDVLV